MSRAYLPVSELPLARRLGVAPFFGDIHNHCDLSYGHGRFADALARAALQLDFASITGHAHWPDMPEPDPRIQYIIDFHEKGFARLKSVWPHMMETLRERNEEGRFVIFPGFEMHFSLPPLFMPCR